MWKYSIVAVTVFVLAACGQTDGDDDGDDGGEPSAPSETTTAAPDEPAPIDEPVTMPEVTLTVSETGDDGEVAMEATVTIEPDGSWQRSGTESGSGSLTDEQIQQIDQLTRADDFPEDPDEDDACMTVVPSYYWLLESGEDRVSNGNGGCVDSPSAVEIVNIIQQAADVGPTLAENQ